MNTIDNNILIKGVGIHSGQSVTMHIQPVDEPGISFEYDNHTVSVCINNIGENHLRSTTLTNGVITIQTPEHFLAACYALQLTNIKVLLSAIELPILDGSAIEFIHQIKPFLTPIKGADPKQLIVSENVHYSLDESHYFLFPSDKLTITVALSYPDHWLKSLTYSFQYSHDGFIQAIAPARTYGFTHEIEYLKEKGLIKGGSLENALLISDSDYVNEPRFDNEIIRHKLLDFIGDFCISGHYLTANCFLIKPSHQGNCGLVKQLFI